ncbi:hypothetical protein [Vitiosangium sp. GDMCC 1.1324]|uniref:hypothetical protein n=1 Tax=Vitiosangium sp. (strain GDMCC 1.1324) TaxID=2138576 RepID=UPI000D3D3045|nr:hypothetical protein [Vitiosangium sp. GDMCC 1.1324]PTL83404.1 hypothetical protein DAT35_15630 [Vitiosangium sp. GDMCC 1.1324]
MQIYSSAQTKKKTEQPHAIYYSRTKLISGAVIWTLGMAFFGLLTYRLRAETGAMLLTGLVTFGAIRMFFNCVRPLGSLDKPALIIGKDGIRFEDGLLIGWDDMQENVYLNQTYMGIPILKMVQIKTTLDKPKVKKMRVAALALDSDEYLALCDSYSQGATPSATR